jgi:hypothetical protein
MTRASAWEKQSMRRLGVLLSWSLAGLYAVSVFAQEGHPLTGTWSGDWGPRPAERTHITMVMTWDGTTVTGTINPGSDAIPVQAILLDATNWTIRFEADAKDSAGAAVHIAAEGRLDDIASYHRTITGTWRQGSSKGDFTLTRD